MQQVPVSSRLVQDTLRYALDGREKRFGRFEFVIDSTIATSEINAKACVATIILNVASALQVYEERYPDKNFSMDFYDLVETAKLRFTLEATLQNGVNFSSNHIGEINDWLVEFHDRCSLKRHKPADMIAEQNQVAEQLGILI